MVFNILGLRSKAHLHANLTLLFNGWFLLSF